MQILFYCMTYSYIIINIHRHYIGAVQDLLRISTWITTGNALWTITCTHSIIYDSINLSKTIIKTRSYSLPTLLYPQRLNYVFVLPRFFARYSLLPCSSSQKLTKRRFFLCLLCFIRITEYIFALVVRLTVTVWEFMLLPLSPFNFLKLKSRDIRYAPLFYNGEGWIKNYEHVWLLKT